MRNEKTPRFVSRLTKVTLALIMAGGRGKRLEQLTKWRVKPAVPFGGKFRIIDFTLSNCINSGIRRIGVLTQYKAHSLIVHIQQGWGIFRGEFGEFIELLPAQQRVDSSWYAGTADAVFQNIDIIRNHEAEYALILSGDHVYKMDYGEMLAYHVEKKADITIACVEVPLDKAHEFGVMGVDNTCCINKFTEKPTNPDAMPDQADKALCSMGIYVFNTDFLIEQLIKDADNTTSNHDFGKDIIPDLIDKYRAFAYQFHGLDHSEHGYWRDVGTVDAFWHTNMELTKVKPELNLYDDSWPIWTYQEQVPPAKFVFDDNNRRGEAIDSLVSGGCIISGSTIRNSLIFSQVTVKSYSKIDQSVVLPNVSIGENCVLHRTIIDEGCIIPSGMKIGVNKADDKKQFYVSPDGITLVVPEMLGQQIHHVR